jgi:hypothetical protein
MAVQITWRKENYGPSPDVLMLDRLLLGIGGEKRGIKNNLFTLTQNHVRNSFVATFAKLKYDHFNRYVWRETKFLFRNMMKMVKLIFVSQVPTLLNTMR